MEKNNTTKKKIKCTRCGSTNVAKYLYGMPLFDKNLEKKIADGKIKLGGCVIHEYDINKRIINMDPLYYCNACKKDFWTEPIILHELNEAENLSSKYNPFEDLRDTTTQIHLKIEGYLYGEVDFYVEKKKRGAFVLAKPYMSLGKNRIPDEELEQGKTITKKEWKNIITGLYDKAHVHEWKKSYKAIAEDAVNWKLELGFEDGSKKQFRGKGAYPPYWKEFKEAFLPYAKL